MQKHNEALSLLYETWDQFLAVEKEVKAGIIQAPEKITTTLQNLRCAFIRNAGVWDNDVLEYFADMLKPKSE